MFFYVPFSITPQVIRRIPIYTLLFLMRSRGIEPLARSWKDQILPLYYKHFLISCWRLKALKPLRLKYKHWRVSNPLLWFCRSYHKPLQCLFGVHCDTLPSWWKVRFIPHLPGGESNPRYNVNSITFYHWTTEYRKVRDLNPRFLSERSFSRRVP